MKMKFSFHNFRSAVQIFALISILIALLGVGSVPVAQAKGASVPLAAAPVNDSIAGAKVLPGNGPYSDTIDTSEATPDASDPLVPDPATNSNSCDINKGWTTVWYKFTPSYTGPVSFTTYGSNYDTTVSIWTGSPSSLTFVTCNDDVGPGVKVSSLIFNVVAGTTYYIDIAQFNGYYGEVNQKPSVIGGTLNFMVSFSDVESSFWAWEWVIRLYNAGITGGCNVVPLYYCPNAPVTRGQMAVFLEKGMNGSSYNAPTVPITFGDTSSHWARYFIEALKTDGVTGGCSTTTPPLYCPNAPVTRAQMAIFLLKAEHGSTYAPPDATGIFTDVPTTYWAADWIEQLFIENITGGCNTSPLQYCPDAPVTRAQMAVFLVKNFKLP